MTGDREAEIRATIEARNALRKEAQLPLLDVEGEVRKSLKVVDDAAADGRYEALCETYAQKRRDIRMEIIDRARAAGNTTYPNGYFGNYQLHTLVEKQFHEFLSNRTPDDDKDNNASSM